MANPSTTGSGNVKVPAADVTNMLIKAIGFPTTIFLTVQKARVLADGSLEANYNYSTEGPPPAPQGAIGEQDASDV